MIMSIRTLLTQVVRYVRVLLCQANLVTQGKVFPKDTRCENLPRRKCRRFKYNNSSPIGNVRVERLTVISDYVY